MSGLTALSVMLDRQATRRRIAEPDQAITEHDDTLSRLVREGRIVIHCRRHGPYTAAEPDVMTARCPRCTALESEQLDRILADARAARGGEQA